MLVDVLLRIASESEVDELLRRALAMASGAETPSAMSSLPPVPERPEELLFFTSGPLYDQAQTLLGRERAERLLQELSPVLDRAWELDRRGLTAELLTDEERVANTSASQLPTSGMVRKKSGAQPIDTERAMDEDVLDEDELSDRDTVPAVDSDAGSLEPPAASEPILPEQPAVERHLARPTLPYMPEVLSSDADPHRVLVIDSDAVMRTRLATSMRSRGWVVATAPEPRSASRLVARLQARVIVADLETVAPDYEPLGPALDDLLAGPPSSASLPQRPAAPAQVVLLHDRGRRDSSSDLIEVTFCKPVEPEQVIGAVSQLLDDD